MLARLAGWCFDHRWKVVGAWVLLLVGVFAWGGAIGGSKPDGAFDIPSSDSRSGIEVLEESFPGMGGGFSGSIVFRSTRSVTDEAIRTPMIELFDAVAAIDGLTVESPYVEPAGQFQISDDQRTAFATINVDPDVDPAEAAELGEEIDDLLPTLEGTEIHVGGAIFAGFEPPMAELIGLAFAIVVLILSFGSVLAMGLPIAVALAGVGVGSGIILLLTHVLAIPDETSTIGAMIGLGVGIDYALFIVTRYREGLHSGLGPRRAACLALDTAGRAVVFAGMTVVISLLGMLIMQLKFVTGMGIGAAVTVAVTMLASITLLPALLSLAGGRVEVTRWRGLIAAGFVAVALLGVGLGIDVLLVGLPLAVVVMALGFAVAPLRRQVEQRPPRPRHETIAYRWSHAIQRRPWTSVIVASAALLTLAIPLASLQLGSSDDGNFPESTATRKAYDMLAAGFGSGFNGPLIVTATVPDGVESSPEALQGLAAALADAEGVAESLGPIPDDMDDPANADAFLFRVIPTTSPQDRATSELIDRLRDEVIPAATGDAGLVVHVTGMVAVGHDFTAYLGGRMPTFIGVVLALSFVLLMAVFRSLLVPLKAVVMNLLSIAAAYGIVVAIFQWGWLGDLIGIAGAPIESFLPMMMFAIVFGLSMDYEVFLLSRVKEEYDRTGDAKNSVADGLAATARVITAAAAIMVVVFGSFVFEDNRIIKMFGVGLAVAVFLDATLVRMLLVPATMELLGDRNWWFPKWLDRLLPRIDVEGHAAEAALLAEAAAAGDLDAEAAQLEADAHVDA